MLLVKENSFVTIVELINNTNMKTRKLGEEPKQFKILKNIVSKVEEAALQKACKKFNCQPNALKANHTQDCFVFTLK